MGNAKQPPRGWAWWDNVVHKRSKDDELIGRWMQRRKVKLNGFPDEREVDMECAKLCFDAVLSEVGALGRYWRTFSVNRQDLIAGLSRRYGVSAAEAEQEVAHAVQANTLFENADGTIAVCTPDHANSSQDHEKDALQIIRQAFGALIRQYEFLGYQLSHANGGMDDAQLEEIASEYLVERHYTDDELHVRLVVLKELLGKHFDVDAAATMLQCTIEQVLKAWPKETEETA